MRRPLVIVTLIGLGCGRAGPTRAEERPPSSPDGASAAIDRDRAWDASVASLAATRRALATDWARAATADERAAIRSRASAALVRAITTDLAPQWLGMPWGMGRDSTATRPFAPAQKISCSYFVGAILGGAGFRLHDRFKLGQAAALDIQKSLVGGTGKVHRFLSIPPSALATRIAALGDGLYVIGLANHVGLVVVRGADVRFVHASYIGDAVVTDEPLASSIAIAASQPKGYFVSPLVVDGPADDWLIDRWLAGDPVGPRG